MLTTKWCVHATVQEKWYLVVLSQKYSKCTDTKKGLLLIWWWVLFSLDIPTLWALHIHPQHRYDSSLEHRRQEPKRGWSFGVSPLCFPHCSQQPRDFFRLTMYYLSVHVSLLLYSRTPELPCSQVYSDSLAYHLFILLEWRTSNGYKIRLGSQEAM